MSLSSEQSAVTASAVTTIASPSRLSSAAACTFLVAVIFLAPLASPHNISAQVDKMDFDRSEFGLDATHHTWSQLTPFEQQVVDSLPQLQARDPDALLALFLVASGDIRYQSDYLPIKNRLDHWVKKIESRVSRIRNKERRGLRLFLTMHDEFFPAQNKNSDTPSGYSLDQSRLSEIFRSKLYNCISSALLYIVIAERFDLETQGVVLPSHAFVQLNLNGDESIDVETTSAWGYNLVHDQEFYDNVEANWSSERGLDPSTFEEYQNREIVEPYQLGLHDMWSQHTGPERMAVPDRIRLAEIRSLLAPDDVDAQKSRLFFYNQEFNYLNVQRDYDTMARMYTAIEPYLKQLAQKNFADVEFQNMLAWSQMQTSLAWVMIGRTEEGLNLARSLLTSISPELPNYQEIQNNLYYVITQFVIDSVNEGAYTRAKRALRGLENDCLNFESCAKGMSALYAKWGQFYWDQQQWRQVMNIIEEYLEIDATSSNADGFRQSFEAAHINLAYEYAFDEDRRGAKDVLETCVVQLDKASRCERALKKLVETGKLR